MSEGTSLYITLVLYALPGLVIGFVVHELMHAVAAVRLGDPTPRRMGRLTLSPAEHIDPIGLALLLTVGFGWAKPVQFSTAYIRTGRQQATVAAAGPLTNLVLAIIFALGLRVMLAGNADLPYEIDIHFGHGSAASILFFILLEAFYVNVVLFVFNSLPIPGLDGYAVARGLFGERAPGLFRWMEMNRQLIYLGVILLVFVLPAFSNGVQSPLGNVIGSVNDFLYHNFVDRSTTVQGSLPNIQLLFQ